MLILWILGSPLTRHARYTDAREEFIICQTIVSVVRLLYLLDEEFIPECPAKAGSWSTARQIAGGTFQRDFELWDTGKTECQLLCSTAQQNKRTSAMVYGNKRDREKKIRRISKTWGRKPTDIFMIPLKCFLLTEVPLLFCLKIHLILAGEQEQVVLYFLHSTINYSNQPYLHSSNFCSP